MVSPSDLGSTLMSGFSGTGDILTKIVTYSLYALVIGAVLYGVYVFTSYKYKAYVFIRRAIGNNDYAIQRIKRTRLALTKVKGVRKWKFLFSKQTMPPLDDKYIYTGNNVFLIKTGPDEFMPVSFEMSKDDKEAKIDTIEQDLKFWQLNEISQAAQEYQDIKSKLAPVFITLGTVLLCVILTGTMLYFNIKFATDQTANVVQAIQGIDIRGFSEGIVPT